MSERLVVALRAMTSITNFQHPSPADVARLYSWVDPMYADATDDELARLVIQAEIQKKKVADAQRMVRGAAA